MYPTDLTVAAVVERENKYLFVEETSMGRRVITQPGGHIEAGESPEQAVVREVFEETGCRVKCDDMIGVYLWIHPQTRQQFLRLVYSATYNDDIWTEIGEYIRDGQEPRQTIKMVLTRTGDTAWPAAGAVTPPEME